MRSAGRRDKDLLFGWGKRAGDLQASDRMDAE